MERVVEGMTMLQSRGLGQIFTLKQGNSKVFFKAPPNLSLEVPLNTLRVELEEYEVRTSLIPLLSCKVTGTFAFEGLILGVPTESNPTLVAINVRIFFSAGKV